MEQEEVVSKSFSRDTVKVKAGVSERAFTFLGNKLLKLSILCVTCILLILLLNKCKNLLDKMGG